MAPINEQEFTDFTGLTEEERQRLHELHKNDPPAPRGKGGYRKQGDDPPVRPSTPEQPGSPAPDGAPPAESDE